MRVSVFIIYFLLYTALSAQVKVKDDFLINSDNSPSTFLRENPKIFINDTSEFIITWKDYRKGEPLIYMQRFDFDGNPIGINSVIESDLDIGFSDDGSILNLYSKSGQDFPIDMSSSHLSFYGKIYDLSMQPISYFYLNSGRLPWCATGWLGIDYKFVDISEGYLFFLRDDGNISLSKISTYGSIIFNKKLDTIPFRTSVMSAASNSKSEYMLTCSNYDLWKYYEQDDSLGAGIYAYFFDANDSLIAKDILVTELKIDENNSYPQIAEIKSIAVSDSVYEIFWVDKDSLLFNYIKYSNTGNRLSNIQTIPLPHGQLPLNWSRKLSNFTISKIKDGSFAVYLSIKDFETYPKLIEYFYNSLYYFNTNGELINSQFSNTRFLSLGEQIFKTGTECFYTATVKNNDIFLTKLNNFTLEYITKVNDDLSGSNETDPIITKVDEQTNFIAWNDEIGSKGIKVSINGDLVGKEVILRGNQCVFSPKGNVLNISKKRIDDDFVYLGIDIYDSNWNLIREDSLTSPNYSSYTNGVVYNLSDSTYILCYYSDTLMKIRKMDLDFQFIKEVNLSFKSSIHSAKIIKNDKDDNSFIIYINDKQHRFSNNLELLEETSNSFSFNLYLENDKFLNAQVYSSNILRGSIFTSARDTLSKFFYIASNVEEFTTKVLPNGNFLVVFRNNNKLFARAFSSEGIALADSFLINGKITSNKKLPAVLLNSNKISFAWPENRIGDGYDIYGSIFDYPSVVEVKQNNTSKVETYNLWQNYPNPFNPATKIKYSVPDNVNVTLKIYDILGKEIATLVNEEKSAGIYTVEFNATNLSSGIYFYKISAGNYSEVKKLILLR